MGRRRRTAEQIITALREAEVGLANGKTMAMVSRELGTSGQTYYRWREGICRERPWRSTSGRGLITSSPLASLAR